MRGRQRLIGNGVLVAAVATALVACGGESERTKLAKDANAICARADRALHRLNPPGVNPKAEALWLAKVVRARERELQAIRRLTPSSDLKPAVFRYVENDANVIAGLTTALARARGGETAGVTAVLDFDTGSRVRLRAAARHLGWRRCTRYV